MAGKGCFVPTAQEDLCLGSSLTNSCRQWDQGWRTEPRTLALDPGGAGVSAFPCFLDLEIVASESVSSTSASPLPCAVW